MSSATIGRTQRFAATSANLCFRTSQRRLLSASTSLRAIGPESPEWIEIPPQVQPPRTPLPPVKGVLPVPRDLLPKRRQYKVTSKWLRAATPEPKRRNRSSEYEERVRYLGYKERDRKLEYKERMADMRRKNMREGVSELYKRLIETEDAAETRAEHKILDQLKAQDAPERDDEKWTRVSVSKAIRDVLESKDNTRTITEEERQAKKGRYEKIERGRQKERADSLHALYLHARNFILTEERLDEELEKVFGADDNPPAWAGGARSVWALGDPPSTSKLVGRMPNLTSDSLRGRNHEHMSNIMRERMMKIAGKLTGGEIPESEELKRKSASSDRSEWDGLMRSNR